MNKIVFINTLSFNCPESSTNPVTSYINEREWKEITVRSNVDSVKEYFVNNASYFYQWDSEIVQNNNIITETQEEDLSEYCVAGDIVDHRDGTITVYMGKKTQLELQQETIDSLLLQLLGA